MAYALVWSESAIQALEEAADYIAKDSPSYAASLLTRVEHTAESLPELPKRGRVVPEYEDPEVRELFVGSYRLIYRLRRDHVEIIAFIHGSRDLAALLAERNRDSGSV